jgi:hypothetical protein
MYTPEIWSIALIVPVGFEQQFLVQMMVWFQQHHS